MTRPVIWGLLAAAAVVVIGCGPAKELPEERKTDRGATQPAIVVPAASEPAAKAYIERVLNVYTGGKPELLEKGKYSRTRLKGKQNNPSVGLVEATRTITAGWPDKFASDNTWQVRGTQTVVSAYLMKDRLTVFEGPVELPVPNPIESARNFTIDETAQHWLFLMLPLTDPRAVVFDMRQQTSQRENQQVSVQTLKLGLRDFPIIELTFDAKSDTLMRVNYTLIERGLPLQKQLTPAEYKRGTDGLLLPGKLKFLQNGELAEEWVIESWEFPDTIPDTEFLPPRKN